VSDKVVHEIREAEKRDQPVGRPIGAGVYEYKGVYYATATKPWRIVSDASSI
jgi:hypothetical protein